MILAILLFGLPALPLALMQTDPGAWMLYSASVLYLFSGLIEGE